MRARRRVCFAQPSETVGRKAAHCGVRGARLALWFLAQPAVWTGTVGQRTGLPREVGLELGMESEWDFLGGARAKARLAEGGESLSHRAWRGVQWDG